MTAGAVVLFRARQVASNSSFQGDGASQLRNLAAAYAPMSALVTV